LKFAIIGAGMAGLSCASVLKAAGHAVMLFDKGRGPGGRMSTRRLETPLGDVFMDHGAQYFTARDPGFQREVEKWREKGTVRTWPIAAADAWIGTPGMNAVIRQMTEGHDVLWGCQIAGMMRKLDQWWLIDQNCTSGPFDAVILATPAEQAAVLLSLHDLEMARIALTARSEPCWTSMLVFDQPLPAPQPVIRKRGIISWAARNSAKPGRNGPEAWVVQASAFWSRSQIEATPDGVSAYLGTALAKALGKEIPEPIVAVSHRWRYAIAAGTGDGALWNGQIGIGTCGDWLLGPRVESAWLSGRMLADRCIADSQLLPVPSSYQ